MASAVASASSAVTTSWTVAPNAPRAREALRSRASPMSCCRSISWSSRSFRVSPRPKARMTGWARANSKIRSLARAMASSTTASVRLIADADQR